MIMNVLKDIATNRPDIRNEIVSRLAEISGPSDEAIVIYES
jgi:hypothetical protein